MTAEEYLEMIRTEGCTFTDVLRETGNPNLPVIVSHDGDTCPIHENETRKGPIQMNEQYEKVIRAAAYLVSENGENPEYDRGVYEVIADSFPLGHESMEDGRELVRGDIEELWRRFPSDFPHRVKVVPEGVKERLEYLRGELRGERISYGELAELQGLAEHIEPGDVELLEPAGVPEFPEELKPFHYMVLVRAEDRVQAEQVMVERINYDEELEGVGDYQISFQDAEPGTAFEAYIEVVHAIHRGELDEELEDLLSAIQSRRIVIDRGGTA